jgi:AraC-like DNA-binding protein
MSKTLLVLGAWRDCGKLIEYATSHGWQVVCALRFEKIPAGFENVNINLILVSQCLAETGWEQAVNRILAHDATTVVALSPDGNQDWLARALSGESFPVVVSRTDIELRGVPEEDRGPDDTGRLTLLGRVPGNITTGIKRAIEFIHSHYEEPISLEEAARAAFYSRCYFCKVFKEQIGVSFVSYLSRVRIEHAVDLLVQSDKSITTIAYDVGFNDLSHFERVFRAIQNQSPSQFRRTAKNSPHDYQYQTSLARHAVA